MKNYILLLLFGIILIGFGLGAYYFANLSTTYNIPKGAMRIGIGPYGNMTPISTRIIFSVSVPYDEVNLEVSFSFTEFKKYRIYIIMPYETLQAHPYVIYQHCYYYNETSKMGDISVNFKNFPEKGSSIINATFIPNIGFHFLPNEPVTLSIQARISGLVSINYPLNSKQTIILTFWGDQTGVWDDAMAPYIGVDNYEMIDYPFQVIVQFPKENYLSSDTFPSPIELFVTERLRSVIFDLNFSQPKGYAQSISCSYINPINEFNQHFLTFISGILLTTGITFCHESWKEKRKTREKKTLLIFCY